jgi:hypothetical protein
MMTSSSLEGSEVRLVAHAPHECAGEFCCLHNRSDHHMRGWSQHFRQDRGIMERICPKHGTGHPDPDQKAFFDKFYKDGAWAQWVHGCCGCCQTELRLF